MKRILAMALSVMLVATLAISGTVAYFTDDEKETNVFTVGKIDITLIEEERQDSDGNDVYDKIGEFTQNKNMMPIVGSAQDPKDDWGMPSQESAKNYEDKIVTVKNTGENPAWVRIFFAIPSALEGDVNNASDDVLHTNIGNRYDAAGNGSYNTGEWKTDSNPYYKDFGSNNPEFVTKTTIFGMDYNVWVSTMVRPLGVGEISAPAIIGAYLDSKLDYDDDGNFYFMGSESNVVTYDFTQGIQIPVFAQAIQSEGFTSPAIAFNGDDGINDATGRGTGDDNMPGNPWATTTGGGSGEGGEGEGGSGEGSATQVTAAELKALFDNAAINGDGNTATVEFTSNMTVTDGDNWEPLTLHAYGTGIKNIIIDGNEHTISGLKAPLMAGSYFGNTSIEIKDLTLEKSIMHNKYYGSLGSAAFIAYADSSKEIILNNCHLKDSSITSDAADDTFTGIAGLVGYSSASKLDIINCSVTNTKIDGDNNSAGAIAGHVSGGNNNVTTITNAKVIGCTIDGQRADKTGYVLGTANVGNTIITTDSSCSNNTVFGTENSTTIYGRLVGGTLTVNGNPVT